MMQLVNLLILGLWSISHVNSAPATGLCTDELASTLSNAITSSSQFAPNDKSNNYGPNRALLNTTQVKDPSGVTQMGGWLAEKNNFNQWIQVELKQPSMIRGVITQGRNGCCQQWTTKYRVLYSEDCKHWHTVGGFNTTDAFFNGNKDEDTPVKNDFYCPVMAKCIRINPLGWHGNIAMRFGLVGCPLNVQGATVPTPTPTTTTSTAAPTTTPKPTTSSTTSTTTTTTTTTTTMKPTTATTTTMKPTTSTTTTQSTTTPIVTNSSPTPKVGNNGNVGGGKGGCIKSCKNRANGDYQSCDGCEYFVTCVWESMYPKRPCAKATKWDDDKKRCVMQSKTCP